MANEQTFFIALDVSITAMTEMREDNVEQIGGIWMTDGRCQHRTQ